MNIIIPMAGRGERFKASGFSLSKPLIQVAGMPMYRHATEYMPLDLATQLIFILQKDEFSEKLKEDIEKNYSSFYPSVIVLEKPTRGQAETVLQSALFLNLDHPTLIHNCDTYISPNIRWDAIIQKNIDGAVALFSSYEERWSYAALDSKKEKIIDIKEKK
jgi:NDP-sugar pyrophosphorylase family protein